MHMEVSFPKGGHGDSVTEKSLPPRKPSEEFTFQQVRIATRHGVDSGIGLTLESLGEEWNDSARRAGSSGKLSMEGRSWNTSNFLKSGNGNTQTTLRWMRVPRARHGFYTV